MFRSFRAIATVAIFGGAMMLSAPTILRADDATTKTDKNFVHDAAIGGMTEVQAGILAKSKGNTPEIKAFGERMVTDHTKVNEELKMAASNKGIEVPAALDSSHQKKIDKLAKLTGNDFDKAYVKQMISDHKDTIDLFEKEANKGDDPQLKSWAAEKLPALKEHLSMAEEIEKKM